MNEYNKKEIRKRTHKVFEENGILIFPDEDDDQLLIDSLTLMSLLVCLEGEFNIEIDPVKGMNELLSFNDFVGLIYKCYLEKDSRIGKGGE